MGTEIVVTYESEVLGSGEFWRGPAERIPEIRNIVARKMAREVARTGKPVTVGMWRVSLASGEKEE